MPVPETTSWNAIRAAARGDDRARDRFASCYNTAVRAYLGARWRNTELLAQLEDAVQDVFVECFREHGVLERAEAGRPGGFRAYLYGVVRNVAMRHEKRRRRRREIQPSTSFDPDVLQASGASLSREFDRAWATALLREAVELLAELARDKGEAAVRRVEILRLRFRDGLPIREIARRWDADPIVLHRQYTTAASEFKRALTTLLTTKYPDSAKRIEEELTEIAKLLR